MRNQQFASEKILAPAGGAALEVASGDPIAKHPSLHKYLALPMLGLLLGCGNSGNPEKTAATPTHSGEVWELDRAAPRHAMPAAVLAYTNGLHVVVIDGNDVYAGMTAFKAEPGSAGNRAIKLPGGAMATLTSRGPDRMDLIFATGESIAMHRRRK